jgi:hypothetical protein
LCRRLIFQQAATSLVVGADVIDATRWAFTNAVHYPVRIFDLSGLTPDPGPICAFVRTQEVLQ